MGEHIDKLKAEFDPDVVELGALERVKSYVRRINGKVVRVSSHVRKGEGPGHRSAMNKLAKMDPDHVEISPSEAGRFRASFERAGVDSKKKQAADAFGSAAEHFKHANVDSSADEDIQRLKKQIDALHKSGHLSSEEMSSMHKRLTAETIEKIEDEIAAKRKKKA